MAKAKKLIQTVAIVNPDGTPTDTFMRFIQDNGGLTDSTTTDVVALQNTNIVAGDGLDGGGPLSAGTVTLTASVQEVLDQLSTTQGTVLYRGAADWAGLAPGTSGQVLQTNGAAANPSWATPSTGGISSGTSFPGSPATNDLYFRTDRGIIYYYTGTAWHSVQLLTSGYHSDGVAQSAATAFILPPPYKQQGYSIYIESFTVSTVLTNSSTNSNYFAYRLTTFESSGSVTTNLGSGLTSQNDTQNVWFSRSEAINATVASTIELLYPNITETGTATGFFNFSIAYRLIG